MGNDEAATPTKSDKATSPVQEQPPVHPYPDWATMQAYYGPGVSMPPPYLTAAVASGHAPPPYMWGAQSFMPPYGVPFSAYPHGVYGHPSVPLGAHSQGPGIVPSPSTNESLVMATPLRTVSLVKSSKNKGRGLLKKLKGLDGLPVSNGDCKAGSGSGSAAQGNGSGSAAQGNGSGSAAQGKSQSEESDEGSSDGTDDNYEADNKNRWRGSSEDPTSGKDEKATIPKNGMALTNIIGKSVITELSFSPSPIMESKVSVNGEVTTCTAPLPRASRVPIELRKQEDRTLKREKRKQSNRESARRSRLRKQAETEELAMTVDTLGAENTTLRTEIVQLKENSEKLRLENIALMEELKNAHFSHAEERLPEKGTSQGLPTDSTENLLSKLSDPSKFSSEREETDPPNSSGGKLHQLLGANSRTDAVAAS